MTSVLKKILSDNGNLVQIVTGKDHGEHAWHCVLVKKQYLDIFNQTLTDDTIPLNTYGQILKSGWGEMPPEDILEELAEEYI